VPLPLAGAAVPVVVGAVAFSATFLPCLAPPAMPLRLGVGGGFVRWVSSLYQFLCV